MDSYIRYKYEHRFDGRFDGCAYNYDFRPIVAIYVEGETLKDALKSFEVQNGIKIFGRGKAKKASKGIWRIECPKMEIPDSFWHPQTGDVLKDFKIREKNEYFANCNFICGNSTDEILAIEEEYCKALAKDEENAKREEEARARQRLQQELQKEREVMEIRQRKEREKLNRNDTPIKDDTITYTYTTREWDGGYAGWIEKEHIVTVDRNEYGL